MPTTLAAVRTVSLYYREGSSDKEYHVYLEPKGAGFLVNFAYGRRGSTLSTGTKTNNPVDLTAAEAMFDKLVREKKGKGYTEGPDGTPYQHTDKQTSGLVPQLLNAIDETEASRLVADSKWAMQEKKDGRRLMVRKQGDRIEGINKLGLVVAIPATIHQTAVELNGDFVMDGECIGDKLHAFDLLFQDGKDLRSKPYERRYVDLLNLLASGLPKHICVVQCWLNPQDKAAWLMTLKREKAEGVVFKRLDAPYTAGRPNSGGSQLKYKFVATLSAVVGQVNAKRSVALRLLNHQGWQPVGNVTIPANQPIPKVGAVVEVRYLYAYPEGALFQPAYLGERNDVGQEECVVSQLKFKPDDHEC